MIEAIFRIRFVSLLAVVFGTVGAVTMFIIGSVTTIEGIVTYFGAHEEKAFSTEAALVSTVEMVTALDQFLLGLVLLVFAYGVYTLWIVDDRNPSPDASVHVPVWISVTSITDLKVKLIEVVAVLLAVLFLKGVLLQPITTWPDLVVPITVVLLAWTVWLIRKAEH
jgi:uncharacterized membrane protein YqhA